MHLHGRWHTQHVPRDRDVQAFNDRAGAYEGGRLGRMQHDIAVRTADVAVAIGDVPRRALDVGCGTGLLLRLLAVRLPRAEALVGIDAASGMIDVAESKSDDSRLSFCNGIAEDLPFPDESFDLVVSTTSFDHWKNQSLGLHECARVLAPNGQLVLTDLFSVLLVPTTLAGRRNRARTKPRAETLLRAAGFRDATWRRSYSLIIGTVVASK